MLMVAEKDIQAHALALVVEPPQREYSGYPFWHALLVEPNREIKAADWLHKVHVPVYLPTFSKVITRRGQLSGRREYAVVAGMLFAPCEILQIERRDEIFDYARVRGFLRRENGFPAVMTKLQIEKIREIEAILNLPPPVKEEIWASRGQNVAFKDDVLCEMWGTGVVFEVANTSRIGVEVTGLFGRVTKVYVPQSEIEAM